MTHSIYFCQCFQIDCWFWSFILYSTLADSNLIKVPYLVPCTCPPGQGLTNEQKAKCQLCNKGSFSSGGEDISDWGSWTQNGTSPPPETGITTSCEIYRSYVKPCEHWKASCKCKDNVLVLGCRMVPTKSQESRKISVKFCGSWSLSFFLQKAFLESRILKTKEIGEKTSRVRKNMPFLGVSQRLALTIQYHY